MPFEWDERKRIQNMAKHGIDFVDAICVFNDRRAVTLRSTISSNEERLLTIGMLGLRCVVVVFVQRGGATHYLGTTRQPERKTVL